jgi:hypothetical protein
MTLSEIYDAICMRVWGEATAPPIAENILAGENGVIADIHRKLQEEYNFYFMRDTGTVTTTAGTASYSLPSDYKQIITVQAKVDGEDYYAVPMKPLGTGDAQSTYMRSDKEAEYPEAYDIVDDQIVFYPVPSEDSYEILLTYWKYLTAPTDATFDDFEDDLTMAGSELMVLMGVVEMADVLKEWDTVNRYENKVASAFETLKRRDQRWRQSQIMEVEYSDF